MTTVSTPAVFLDRDGTLIKETGHLHRFDEVKIYPEALQAVSRVNRSGALAVVITNQSAVARGLLSEGDLQKIHRLINLEFQRNGARIDAFYYCPHHPEAGSGPYTQVCGCRKPEPGMLLRAARELGIELKESYMFGDRLDDVETGHRAGCQSILVKTGYGSEEMISGNKEEVSPLRRPAYVAENILEGVTWILERRLERRLEDH